MVWIVGMADRDDSKGGDRGKMPKGRPHKKSAATGDEVKVLLTNQSFPLVAAYSFMFTYWIKILWLVITRFG